MSELRHEDPSAPGALGSERIILEKARFDEPVDPPCTGIGEGLAMGGNHRAAIFLFAPCDAHVDGAVTISP
jgi:hypothetical protein